MIGDPTIVVFLLILAVSLIVSANLITYLILARVNARSEAGRQFSYIFMQHKWPEILARYREFAPQSKLPVISKSCGIAGFALLFITFFIWAAPAFMPK